MQTAVETGSAARSSALSAERSVPFGMYLAKKSVRVLVRSAQRVRVRVAEIDLDAGVDDEGLVARRLLYP